MITSSLIASPVWGARLRLQCDDYIRDLRPTKWGSEVILQSSDWASGMPASDQTLRIHGFGATSASPPTPGTSLHRGNCRDGHHRHFALHKQRAFSPSEHVKSLTVHHSPIREAQ
jgi:hypothetical protein